MLPPTKDGSPNPTPVNGALFGNRVLYANGIKLRCCHNWIREDSKPNMCHVLIRDTHTEHHVKVETEIGVTRLHAKGHKGSRQHHKLHRGPGQSPEPSERIRPCPHLDREVLAGGDHLRVRVGVGAYKGNFPRVSTGTRSPGQQSESLQAARCPLSFIVLFLLPALEGQEMIISFQACVLHSPFTTTCLRHKVHWHPSPARSCVKVN